MSIYTTRYRWAKGFKKKKKKDIGGLRWFLTGSKKSTCLSNYSTFLMSKTTQPRHLPLLTHAGDTGWSG